MLEPQQAIEAVARESYSQLLAFLATRSGGDVASAEDSLSEAFVAALRQWPAEGVPGNPAAWLLTAARRRLTDLQRRGKTREVALASLSIAMDVARIAADAGHDFPDERLKLLFVCAHPAIDPAARTPLMLQTVMGIEADRIASAFLTSPLAMSQRLVRAKAKIRDAGIPFTVPLREEWPERLGEVLDAVYAAFTTGWGAQDHPLSGLEEEAIWLARVIVRLLPEEPEALGLLALLLHVHARRNARTWRGNYVPLPEQDTAVWDRDLIGEAESMLHLAARHRTPGRFQLEAAIQSIHAQRAVTGTIHWRAVTAMYDALVLHTPALGARIGQAVAHAMAGDPSAGLALLDALPQDALQSHQPYWAARAGILSQVSLGDEARHAYTRAIGLCEDAAIQNFLTQRRRALDG